MPFLFTPRLNAKSNSFAKLCCALQALRTNINCFAAFLWSWCVGSEAILSDETVMFSKCFYMQTVR